MQTKIFIDDVFTGYILWHSRNRKCSSIVAITQLLLPEHETRQWYISQKRFRFQTFKHIKASIQVLPFFGFITVIALSEKQEAQLLLGWPTRGTKSIFLKVVTELNYLCVVSMDPSLTDETHE